MCDNCFKLDEQIKILKTTNKEKFIEFELKKRDHVSLAREHREYEKRIRGVSISDPKVYTINTDHMAKKFLIKKKSYTKSEFKICSTFKILPGGHYFAKSNECQYYLTTELFGESANTIISECDDVLKNILKRDVKEIYFVMDNHSTNKNYTVLAYFDYLVNKFFFGIFLIY